MQTKVWIISHKKQFLLLLFTAYCLLLTANLVRQFTIEPTSPPQDVRITNVSDHSLTVSWTTKKPCFGFIFYSSKKYPLAILSKIPFITTLSALYWPFNWPHVATDDHLAFTTTHHATLKNLNLETEYFYRISTGYHLYSKWRVADSMSQKNQQPRATSHEQILPNLKTAKTPNLPSLPNPVYGQIVLEKDLTTPIPNALVYLLSPDSNLISTYTNSAGNYALDLGNLRKKDSNEPINLELNTEFTISANAGILGAGEITVSQKLARPVPKILVK